MPRIEHVVVLMLENRSFDNLLGRLYPKSDAFDGLDLTETNPWRRPDGTIEQIRAWSSAGGPRPCLPDRDPGELFTDMNAQIFGLDGDPNGRPTMMGFVDNYMRQPPERRTSELVKPPPSGPPDPRSIMHAYAPGGGAGDQPSGEVLWRLRSLARLRALRNLAEPLFRPCRNGRRLRQQ